MTHAIRLMHMDPCPLILRGLYSVVCEQASFAVCEQSTQPLDILARWPLTQPDLTLLEIAGGGLAIFSNLRQLTSRYPDARIIVLSDSADEADINRSFHAGAKGYVLKKSAVSQLHHAMDRVLAGERFYCDQPLKSPLQDDTSEHLTAREKEVLGLVFRGVQNKGIANHLCISEWTVKTHIRNILAKLNAISRTEAVSIGLRLGIIRFS